MTPRQAAEWIALNNAADHQRKAEETNASRVVAGSGGKPLPDVERVVFSDTELIRNEFPGGAGVRPLGRYVAGEDPDEVARPIENYDEGQPPPVEKAALPAIAAIAASLGISVESLVALFGGAATTVAAVETSKNINRNRTAPLPPAGSAAARSPLLDNPLNKTMLDSALRIVQAFQGARQWLLGPANSSSAAMPPGQTGTPITAGVPVVPVAPATETPFTIVPPIAVGSPPLIPPNDLAPPLPGYPAPTDEEIKERTRPLITPIPEQDPRGLVMPGPSTDDVIPVQPESYPIPEIKLPTIFEMAGPMAPHVPFNWPPAGYQVVGRDANGREIPQITTDPITGKRVVATWDDIDHARRRHQPGRPDEEAGEWDDASPESLIEKAVEIINKGRPAPSVMEREHDLGGAKIGNTGIDKQNNLAAERTSKAKVFLLNIGNVLPNMTGLRMRSIFPVR